MTRQVLAVANDLQCGGTTGLCPPRIALDDGGYYQYSDIQKAMWQYWRACWNKVGQVAGEDDIYTVLNGEPVDGDHHGTYQLWSKRRIDQYNAAVECLLIPSAKSKKMFFTRGTPAHSGGGFDVEDQIAQEFGGYKRKSHQKIELTLQGNRFLFAHHGPSPGLRDHTWGNLIRLELRDQFNKAIKQGRKPPQYFVWAHFHQKVYETLTIDYKGQDFTMHGYIVPGWQLGSAYISRRIKGENIFEIGMLYFIIEDGRVSHHWIVDRRDTTERVDL